MSAVFFNINDIQAKEVQELMKGEGYTSKAEFFRFLIKFYKYHKSPEERRLEQATHSLAIILKKLESKGKLSSSIDEQLTDV